MGLSRVLGPALALIRGENAVGVYFALEALKERCAGARGRLARVVLAMKYEGANPTAERSLVGGHKRHDLSAASGA